MQVNLQKRENVQTTIVALLVSRKGGCTLSQLSKDYYETEGEHIPWKELGYLSLLSFLQSMSRSVHIEFRNNAFFIRGIASEKSKHVSKLVAGQKDQRHSTGRKSFKPSHYYPNTMPQRVHIPAEILTMIIGYVNENPDGVNKDYLLQKVQSHMPYARISMSDMEEQLQEVSHKIRQSHNKVFPVHSKPRNVDLRPPIVTISGEDDSDDMLDYDEDNDFGFVPSHVSKAKSAVKTKSTSSFIRETVSKCQDQGVENKVSDTHTSRVQDNQTTSFDSHNYCNDNNKTPIELKNNVETENCYDILINKRVKFRLEKLIQSHPNGIWCADLPDKYLQEYKVPLNYAELGFNSVREFASQLPEIFHCIQPNDGVDFILYHAKNEIPSNMQKEEHRINNLAELHQIYDKDDESEALPTTLSLDTCKKLIPDGIISIGECVGQINVGDLVEDERPYIEVVVVEVFTPSFFWIQLRKKQKAFKMFMDSLHEFYSQKCEDYTIPPVVLEKGLNCACIYNGIWHRGIIKTVKPDLQVTVMFYDYGTLKTYPPEAVFYLHRQFSSIPALAIPCGLFNTKPYKGSKWSRSATHHFAVRTSQVPLVATIASINTEDNSMMVTLTDTTEEEDIHINDWLVEQRLAQHGKMVCTKNRNFTYHYYLECQERSNRMSEILGTSKIVQSLKHDKPILFEKYSENKVAPYNSSTPLKSSSQNFHKVNKYLQFVKSQNSSKSDSLVEKCSTANSEEKSLEKLKLYEKLFSFKQNSHSNGSSNKELNNNTESDKSSKSNLAINKISRQKLYEKSLDNNIEYEKRNGITPSTSMHPSDKQINGKTIDESKEHDILKKFSNIPESISMRRNSISLEKLKSVYEELFSFKQNSHSNDSSNKELNNNTESNESSKSDLAVNKISRQKFYENFLDNNIEYEKRNGITPTSMHLNDKQINEKAIDESNEYDILKKFSNIPKSYAYHFRIANDPEDELDIACAETSTGTRCRQNAFEDVDWSVIRKNVDHRNEYVPQQDVTKNTYKSISLKRSNIPLAESCFLKAVRSSTHFAWRDENIRWLPSGNVNQAHDAVPLILKSIKNRKNNNTKEKTIAIPQQVLEMLTENELPENSQESSINTSETTNEARSTSSSQDISSVTPDISSYSNNNDTFNVETPQSSLGDGIPRLENHYLLMKLQTSKCKLLQTLLTKEHTSNNTSCLDSDDLSALETSMSSEKNTSNISEKSEVEALLSSETSALAEETISRELVPRTELLPPDIMNNKSDIPVFNDVDMESDEEELDVHMSYNDVCDFFKVNHPFRKTIEAYSQFEQESNAHLQIEEINDSVETESILDEKQENNMKESICSKDEMLNSRKQLSIESENFMDQSEESESQNSTILSDKNLEINSKDNLSPSKADSVVRKSQEKGKTLKEMLRKVKLLKNGGTS